MRSGRNFGFGFALAAALMVSAGTAFAGFDSIRPDDPKVGKGGELPPGVKPKILEKVGIEEHLGRKINLNYQFIDETGYPVTLSSYFHKDRPVLLDLIYYTCPMLCDLILNGQVEAMKQLAWTPGNQYEIVTISINPQETFDLARNKKATYLDTYGKPAPGWHFLTDYQGNVKRLAEEVGYHYAYDPKIQQFAHASAIMLLTPEGKMARYLYGIQYPSKDLRFAITEASQGRSTPAIDRIILWCYHYDPATNSYVLFAQHLMTAGGAATVLVLGFVLWRLYRVEKKRAERYPSHPRERTA
jgi:protein SCO1